MTAGLGVLLLYAFLQLVLGVVVFRFVRTEDDFLLAGRRLGPLVVCFSVFATWFGAESCLGTAGATYRWGWAGATADPFGYGLCILLMGGLFAVRFWKMRLVTVADFVGRRFSATAERLTAALMIPTSLLWAAAQVRAFATIITAFSDLSVTAGVIVATGLVVAYTWFGGMLADALTDVVQGLVLFAGLAVLLGVVAAETGLTGLWAGFSAGTGTAAGGTSWSLLATAEAWAIPVCGSLFAQELVSRVLSSRSAGVARASTLTAGAAYILVGLIPVTLGVIGARVLPGLEHHEQILPAIAALYLSPILATLFSGAIISAILSTVDSALLSVSALFVRNILTHQGVNGGSSRVLRIERMLVLTGGIAAALIALSADSVYELVKNASAFGSAGIFVVMTMGGFTRFGGRLASAGALLGGSSVWIAGHYIMQFEFSYLLSLAASLGMYLAGAMIDRAKVRTR
jgi:Na+/proline symporter